MHPHRGIHHLPRACRQINVAMQHCNTSNADQAPACCLHAALLKGLSVLPACIHGPLGSWYQVIQAVIVYMSHHISHKWLSHQPALDMTWPQAPASPSQSDVSSVCTLVSRCTAQCNSQTRIHHLADRLWLNCQGNVTSALQPAKYPADIPHKDHLQLFINRAQARHVRLHRIVSLFCSAEPAAARPPSRFLWLLWWRVPTASSVSPLAAIGSSLRCRRAEQVSREACLAEQVRCCL
jgi:hypothetical protein